VDNQSISRQSSFGAFAALLPSEHKFIVFFDNFHLRRQTDANVLFPIFLLLSITFILWQREPISEFLVIAAKKFPQN
jgi:hypothetical protein